MSSRTDEGMAGSSGGGNSGGGGDRKGKGRKITPSESPRLQHQSKRGRTTTDQAEEEEYPPPFAQTSEASISDILSQPNRTLRRLPDPKPSGPAYGESPNYQPYNSGPGSHLPNVQLRPIYPPQEASSAHQTPVPFPRGGDLNTGRPVTAGYRNRPPPNARQLPRAPVIGYAAGSTSMEGSCDTSRLLPIPTTQSCDGQYAPYSSNPGYYGPTAYAPPPSGFIGAGASGSMVAVPNPYIPGPAHGESNSAIVTDLVRRAQALQQQKFSETPAPKKNPFECKACYDDGMGECDRATPGCTRCIGFKRDCVYPPFRWGAAR